MSISSYTIAVDCDKAAALAQFWSAVLGEPVAAGSSEDFAALEPGATAPGMIFCKVPEPKTSKNRAHLGLAVAALDNEVSRIAALGAREIACFDQDGGRVRPWGAAKSSALSPTQPRKSVLLTWPNVSRRRRWPDAQVEREC